MTDNPNPTMPPGWYNDPTGVGEARYWDGTTWTQSVSTGGVTVNAPIEPDKATVPPIRGTEFRATAPPPIPTPAYVPPPIEKTPPPQRSSGGLIGTILAIGLAIIVVIVLIAVLNNGDDNEPDPPAPTEAPAQTDAPAESDSDDG